MQYTYKDIILLAEQPTVSIESTLEALVGLGYCPNLLSDDNGHWAVTFDGLQNVPFGEEAVDIVTTMFVEATAWKDTIREALLYALKQDEEE